MKLRMENWQIYNTNGDTANPRYVSYQDEAYIDIKEFDLSSVCAFPEDPQTDTKYGGLRTGIISLKFIRPFGGYREDIACNIYTDKGAFLTTGHTTARTLGDTTTMFSVLGTGYYLDNANSILLKDIEGRVAIGAINVYFFEDSEHAIAYLNSADKDFYAKTYAWNYNEIQETTNPLNTTFYVYRNNTWKPKTTIRWKSNVISKGKRYEPEDCIINIRVWQTVKNVLGWTPDFPNNTDSAPVPVPDGTQVLFTGRFSEGKYQITYDKLLKIFNKKAFPTAYGFIFEFWVKAADGSETRHCWAYLHNENGVQYNKVPLKNWGAGYYTTSGEDTSTAVLGEGDGESDSGYEEFNDSTQTPEAVTPFSAVGALTQSYALTTSRCKSFGDYLWNAGVFSNIKLMNNSPIENVVACKIFPMSFSGTDEKIKIGNVTLDVQGAKMNSNSTFLYDVGTITLREYYHSFLDYEPFTSVNIFLPFIGFQTLPCTLLMNHSINVKYAVDVITGSCKALIFRDGLEVLSFSGVMGIDIPVSAQNRAQVEMAYIETGAKTAIDTVATVATGGASKAMTAISAVGGASEGLLDLAKAQYRTSTTGSHNSATSACETLQCYIIVDRPIWQNLEGFNHAYGRMCNLTQNLSNLRGFTICNSHIDLSGIECTEEEREEIFNYLTGGVIL